MDLSICSGLRLRPHPTCFTDKITWDYSANLARDATAELLGLKPNQVTASDKSPQTVRARSLLCYWAHRKLGMSTIEIAKTLNMNQSAISRLSRRGEQFASENGFELLSRNKA